MAKVELLSPAKSADVGITAIRNGADAVYIGAPRFGARSSASNSYEEIERLTEYAHRFYCRVFVTLNTILYDSELAEAERMIHKLYEIGVDGIIVQDMSILRMSLPPIALHASTQCHNYDRERIRFLDSVGFNRIILAREMDIEEIRAIRREVKAELELFVHGALCVSLSGQCYMSQHLFGRSANRGECAQPCRQRWSLKDNDGKILVRDKHLLSLKDMNRSAYLAELIDAGVNSFKIEGRLKEGDYVANVTRYYSELLEHMPNVERVGCGRVESSFRPDPERSFNRGFTDYFLHKREDSMSNPDTPKSMGKYVGRVLSAKGNLITAELDEEIHNGDGLCYIAGGELYGVKVNRAEGERLICHSEVNVKSGTPLYRNYDHHFTQLLERGGSDRRIGLTFTLSAVDEFSASDGLSHSDEISASGEAGGAHNKSQERGGDMNDKGFRLKAEARDESGVAVSYLSPKAYEEAENPSQRERLSAQFERCGDTIFRCDSVVYEGERVLFVPSAEANAIRREVLEMLLRERERLRPRLERRGEAPDAKYPASKADWRCNVVNSEAERFYREHGCSDVEWGYERGDANANEGIAMRDGAGGKGVGDMKNRGNSRYSEGEDVVTRDGALERRALMTTKFCLLHELGLCLKEKKGSLKLPLHICNSSNDFELKFDCSSCQMSILE